MLEAGLVIARFLHYAAVMALFGVALFPLYTYPSRETDPPAQLRRWLRRMTWTLTLAAALCAVAWGIFVVASMAGTVAGAFEWDTVRSVLTDTGFGQVWMARLALLLALLALVAGSQSVADQRGKTVAVLSGMLLASLSCVGHTQAHEGVALMVHVAADAAHLVAAGAWFGGLLALGYLLAAGRRSPSPDDTADAPAALVRFSGMGTVAVAVLVGSGAINAWFLIGSLASLTETAYGRLLLAKLGLFAGMLALAAMNRFWLVPALVDGREDGVAARLRRHVLGEQALAFLIILIVSWLGTMRPAVEVS